MAISLSKGQKVSLTKEKPGLSKVCVGLGWDEVQQSKGLFSALFKAAQDIDCDASVYLLKNGKLASDDDMVFFNNKKHKSGAVYHHGDNLTGAGEGDDVLADHGHARHALGGQLAHHGAGGNDNRQEEDGPEESAASDSAIEHQGDNQGERDDDRQLQNQADSEVRQGEGIVQFLIEDRDVVGQRRIHLSAVGVLCGQRDQLQSVVQFQVIEGIQQGIGDTAQEEDADADNPREDEEISPQRFAHAACYRLFLCSTHQGVDQGDEQSDAYTDEQRVGNIFQQGQNFFIQEVSHTHFTAFHVMGSSVTPSSSPAFSP